MVLKFRRSAVLYTSTNNTMGVTCLPTLGTVPNYRSFARDQTGLVFRVNVQFGLSSLACSVVKVGFYFVEACCYFDVFPSG